MEVYFMLLAFLAEANGGCNQNLENQTVKVAIVGAGIGGASFTKYFDELSSTMWVSAINLIDVIVLPSKAIYNLNLGGVNSALNMKCLRNQKKLVGDSNPFL